MTVGAWLLCRKSHCCSLSSSEVFPIPVSPYFIRVSHQDHHKKPQDLASVVVIRTSFIKLMTIPYLSSRC